MLFNKSFLPSLTLLSFSLVASVSLLASLPAFAGEKDMDRHQGELLAQTATRNELPNGTYLYGSSRQPEQIGQEYMVFQVHQGTVKGAVYMPRSEFSCFTGTFEGNQMRMSIVDPYDGTRYDYAVTLQVPSKVASNGQWSDMGLAGYYRLDKMSPNDQKILGTCS